MALSSAGAGEEAESLGEAGTAGESRGESG